MPNVDRPIGFRPAMNFGHHAYQMMRVDVGNSTAIFVGDVMDLDAAGVIPAAADAGVSAAGVCIAVYDVNGVPCGHPNAAVSTKYLTATTAGYALIALALPGAVFIAQTQSGETPDEDDPNITCDHIATAGDTVTARSRHELAHSGGGVQFRYLGKVDEPGNSWGANVDLYVVFNESAYGLSGVASV